MESFITIAEIKLCVKRCENARVVMVMIAFSPRTDVEMQALSATLLPPSIGEGEVSDSL
jgi:hypothetical protein